MNLAEYPVGTAATELLRERWATETPYLADRIGTALGITATSMILDCGIGRISKALIERFQCRVVGH
jgi:hypothetical protein